MGGRVVKKIAMTGQISKAKEIPEKIHLRYFLKFIGAVFSDRDLWGTKLAQLTFSAAALKNIYQESAEFAH